MLFIAVAALAARIYAAHRSHAYQWLAHRRSKQSGVAIAGVFVNQGWLFR
jgi:hypothetical protein